MSWGEPSYTGPSPIFQYQIRVRRCLSLDIDAPCTSWTGWGYARNLGGSARTGLITTYSDDKGTEDTGDDEDLNLQPNTRYEARVQARSRPGGTMDTVYGEWSEAKTFTTTLPRPTDLLATPGDTQITLTWQSSETNPAQLTHYTVEYADNAAFTNPQSRDTGSSNPGTNTLAPTELTVTGLTNEVEYHFRVRAVRGTATSPWSGSVSATPAPATDYDEDNDGLIDVERLAQLNGIRYDLDGDGMVTDDTNTADVDEAHAYLIAFPNPVAGMGCPAGGCTGYELVSDLDFDENGNNTRDDTYTTGEGWDPIDDDSNLFTAVFEGNGYAISNLFIGRSTTIGVGLFGNLDSGSVVRNVGVADAVVTGHDYVGILVGNNEGRVSASWSSGRVTGTGNYVGGLAGNNSGAIAASYSSATVSATGSDSIHTGGLVGSNGGATILASYATGRVSGDDAVGGLVGTNEGGDITASYSTGVVSGNTDTGGLVGANVGSGVSASYWDTERSGQTTSAAGTGKTGAGGRAPPRGPRRAAARPRGPAHAASDLSQCPRPGNPRPIG
ncbi:MAG: fibronectin type III domain-containing protein, partial [Acidimicrobiia bacterium]|nr:fibronectin type III domain-containing protein [Acidimicrobiia bacterium]